MEMTRFDKNTAAVAFAEAGEHTTAAAMLDGDTAAQKTKAPGPAARPYGKALVLGGISLCAYLLLFHNERWVMEHFTRGGIYTLLPVLTAFFFSFVHGPFGNSLLSSLGLEAKRK